MATSYFLLDYRDRIGTIQINRPDKRNAFNEEMWGELTEIVRDLGLAPEVQVIVIRGVGHQAFSAGADISEFDDDLDEPRVRRGLGAIDACLRAIQDCPKAVIAMIYGYALGGGCSLALACDLRLAGESAQFGLPVARLGIVNTIESHVGLIVIAGPAQAARLLFTGATFDAKTALQMGVATAVYPDGILEMETRGLAQQIAQNSPGSIAGAKKIIRTFLRDPGFRDSPEIGDIPVQSFLTADRQEGSRAFLERRRPVFRGV